MASVGIPSILRVMISLRLIRLAVRRAGPVAAIMVFVLLTAAGSPRAQVLALGTGLQGSWTYSAGAAVARVASDHGLNLRVLPYGGNGTMVPLLDRGDLDFGLASHFEAIQATWGDEGYNGRTHLRLRVASVLAPLYIGLYVWADSDIRTVADLRGRRVPTAFASQRVVSLVLDGILANGGIAPSSVQAVPVPNVNRGVDTFLAGRADAFLFALNAPKVLEAHARAQLRLLPLDPSPEAMIDLRRYVPVADAARIEPARGEIGIEAPTHALSYDYLLLTTSEVPAAHVYAVVKALHDGRAALPRIFPPLRTASADRMARPLRDLRYHEGAIKRFEELGLWPDRP